VHDVCDFNCTIWTDDEHEGNFWMGRPRCVKGRHYGLRVEYERRSAMRETNQNANAMDIYVSETRRLREGRTQHHDVSYWRSYLTRSEIDATWVSKEPVNGREVKPGEKYVTIDPDERTTQLKNSLHETSECLTRISNLKTQIGKHAVAFISAQRNNVHQKTDVCWGTESGER